MTNNLATTIGHYLLVITVIAAATVLGALGTISGATATAIISGVAGISVGITTANITKSGGTNT